MSSSGHLVLLERIFERLDYHIPDLEQAFCGFANQIVSVDVFFHLLHGPTLIVVALFFFKQWFFLLRNIRRCYWLILKIIFLTGIADVITTMFFILFKLFPFIRIPLGFGFCITGIILYSLRFCTQGNAHFDWKKAVILGCIQGCALLPGISRLATVYVGARWLGLRTDKAFSIAWLVQWPLIFAAFTHGMYVLSFDQCMLHAFMTIKMGITLVVAIVSAYALLSFVNSLAEKNKLWWFSLYMPVPILMWLIFF